ncbi:CatB-related O-acetyltransferase [Roseomonas sp. CCTCC AB2023176]|uniref:CatB-related O-acetyltransferase n=1 Tax=Roseomonas sp. CCTCC AB2023176 TaxID=3342640 RepID=UPI0035DEB0A6
MRQARDLFQKSCPPELHAAWERLGGFIGEYSYGPIKVTGLAPALAAENIFTIGRFCSISNGVTLFLCHDHNTKFVTTYPFNVLFGREWPEVRKLGGHPRSRGPIHIGNDVWLASEVSILSGVRIGDGAVIGHRSVVTRDVGPYEIWAGQPARKIRNRFDEKARAALLRIKWWDLPIEDIRPLAPLLMSEDPQPLITAVRTLLREWRLKRDDDAAVPAEPTSDDAGRNA